MVIADFEPMFSAVDTLLDVVPENTLLEIVKSVDRLDSTLLKRMLCQHASGLYVLPRPHELTDAARLAPESLPRAEVASVHVLRRGGRTRARACRPATSSRSTPPT